MKQVFTTKRSMVLSIITSVLVVAGACVLMWWITHTKAELVDLRQNVLLIERDDLVSLKRAMRTYTEHAPLLDRVLLNKADVYAFIEAIESLAEHVGGVTSVEEVTVMDVAMDGTTHDWQTLADTERSHGTLTMTVRLDGTWDELMSFLLAIETLPRATRVDATRFAVTYDPVTKTQSWTALFELVTIIE